MSEDGAECRRLEKEDNIIEADGIENIFLKRRFQWFWKVCLEGRLSREVFGGGDVEINCRDKFTLNLDFFKCAKCGH